MMKRTNQQNSADIYHLKEAVVELKEHAQTSNHEVGIIKDDIITIKQEMAVIKGDIGWLKDIVSKVDTRTWAILATIIVGVLLQIIFKLYG